MSTNPTFCNLCGGRQAQVREGRLGRYRVTCDACEARKGSHLVRTTHGYASRIVMQQTPALIG
ncbi:MAG: hypothetical protein AAF548_14305 [Actinomycetota bacterium]